MMNLSGWDIGLLVVVGFVAIASLVRLMRQRHTELANQLRSEYQREKARAKKKKLQK